VWENVADRQTYIQTDIHTYSYFIYIDNKRKRQKQNKNKACFKNETTKSDNESFNLKFYTV